MTDTSTVFRFPMAKRCDCGGPPTSGPCPSKAYENFFGGKPERVAR